jgi:hypothetical protein
MVRLIAQGFS